MVHGKGRGILAAERIRVGSFVLEYKTHAVYRREMHKRIKEYEANDEGLIISATVEKSDPLSENLAHPTNTVVSR